MRISSQHVLAVLVSAVSVVVIVSSFSVVTHKLISHGAFLEFCLKNKTVLLINNCRDWACVHNKPILVEPNEEIIEKKDGVFVPSKLS